MDMAVRPKLADLPNDELVKLKVAITDRRAVMKREFDAAYEKLKEKEEKIKAEFLQRFAASGTESVRTKYGTAFKQMNKTVSVGSPESFREFIRATGAVELMESRCSKSEVLQYLDEHESLPPGINYREEIVVNVRRS